MAEYVGYKFLSREQRNAQARVKYWANPNTPEIRLKMRERYHANPHTKLLKARAKLKRLHRRLAAALRVGRWAAIRLKNAAEALARRQKWDLRRRLDTPEKGRAANREDYHRYKNLEKRRFRDQNNPEKLLKRRKQLEARTLQGHVKGAAKGLRRLEGLERKRLKHIESLQREKLIERIRERIRQALKRTKKSASINTLLGCTASEAWAHLEKQFKPGMTRENHGPVWHIDHIRPCASFNLADPEQQRECFHYTNLQPLFALDNIRKGAKYSPLT